MGRWWLGAALILAGCAGSPLEVDDTLPSGRYEISSTDGWELAGMYLGWTYRFTVVSATGSRVVLDWTAGDVNGSFPVRDTATVEAGRYVIRWTGARSMQHTLRFDATTCDGRDDQEELQVVNVWYQCRITPK